MSAPPSQTITWTCDQCGFPITTDGYLCVDRQAAHTQRPDYLGDLETKSQAVTLGDLLATPPPVPWLALHAACDTNPDGPDYWIEIDRIRTHADLLNRTAHLMGKTWLPHTNWPHILETATGSIR